MLFETTPHAVSGCHWAFPPAAEWPDDDLVGGGADLEPSTLIYAYSHGMFPMGIGRGSKHLGWWSPNPRGILPLSHLHVSRSMKQSAKKYTTHMNTNFSAVMAACASPIREGAWITSPFIAAYERLHEMGWAHSVETYNEDGHLVGGLYGVRVGGLFAGESMFHLQRDASKVALMHLVEHMRNLNMSLLDVQWSTPHLASLGVVEVSREEYLSQLSGAISGQ